MICTALIKQGKRLTAVVFRSNRLKGFSDTRTHPLYLETGHIPFVSLKEDNYSVH